MAFDFGIGFEENYFTIDGRSALHITVTAGEAASSIVLYRFEVTLRSTNGLYSQSFSAFMPEGQARLSIPYIVPLEWANDFAVNIGDLAHADACGSFTAVMTVHYTGYAGTRVFEHEFTGYRASVSGTVDGGILPEGGTLTALAVDGRVPAEWGLWVQGISVARIACTGAAGTLGSSIAAYYFNGGGAQAGNTAELRLTESGNVTVSVTVEDSRLRRVTRDLLLQVQPYAPPALTGISSRRCNADGTENEEGECFAARYTATGSALGGCNPLTVRCAWKAVTAEDYGAPAVLDAAEGESVVQAGLQKGTSYDVQYTVSDAFYSIDFYDYVSGTVYLLHFLKGGTGIAVGKAAEQANLFDVALDTRLRRDLAVGGGLAVTGAFTLGGVDVGTALARQSAREEGAFAVDLTKAAEVGENRILRCGQLVLYRLQCTLSVQTWEGEEFRLASVPQGFFSAEWPPVVVAVQNGVPCKGRIDPDGGAYILPDGDGRQATELYGFGIV